MVTSLLIGLCCLFFIMGHSTLLYFRGKESSSMPLKDLFFPRPQRGKLVSFLCIGLSMVSLFWLVKTPCDLHYPISLSTWKILLIMVIFPSALYVLYLLRRIRRGSKGLLFFPSDAARSEWSLPLIIAAFISFLVWILSK
jgi:hypothetical protein